MKYIYEFIGTFFLVLTVGMTVVNPNGIGNMAPLAIGSVLACMIYAGAHISGAHYNPAVSLAVFLRNRMLLKEMIYYWIAQFAAAVVAAYFVIYFKGQGNAQAADIGNFKAFLAEFFFTFALCYVVLNVATAKANKSNVFYGFAIGFIVLAGAYAVGSVSGAAFNPAVALGITIDNLSTWSNLWVFLLANFLGGAVAALLFRKAHPKEIVV